MAFLQWALPRLRLRWCGFRKVRGQVCKRIGRRVGELGLVGLHEYRERLAHDPEEWARLDALCGVTVSRFYRDRGVFEFLRDEVFPELARSAAARPERRLSCWSAGCASGEEPYTLAILWRLEIATKFPTLRLHVLASDTNAEVLARARSGCYQPSSLKEAPVKWLAQAFEPKGALMCVRDTLRATVDFVQQDIRVELPCDDFDLVLCRNIVLTYFEPALQLEVMRKILQRLRPGGALVVGIHESLPVELRDCELWPGAKGIYRKHT